MRTLLVLSLGLLLLGGQAAAKTKSGSVSKAKPEGEGCRSCVSQAAALFAVDKLPEAASLLSSWSGRCPGSSQLHLLYSTILLRLQDLPGAERESALAVAAQPDSQAARLQYALTLLGQEKHAQARAEFEKVTELDPGSYEAWSALADLYKRLHEDEPSKEAAARAAVLEPNTQAVRLNVIRNLYKAGKPARAKAEIQKLLDSGFGPEFNQSLAKEALDVGALEQSEKAAAQVLSTYPKSGGAAKTLMLAQYLSHKYPESLATAEKFADRAPDSSEAHALRSLALLSLGRSADAARAADAAFSKGEASPYAQLAMARVKLAQGKFDQSRDLLRECLASGSSSAKSDRLPQTLAHLELARLYLKQSRFEESIKQAQIAGEDRRATAEARALEAKAILRQAQGEDYLGSARELLSESAPSGIESPEVRLARALCELKAGKPDQAAKIARELAAWRTNDPDAYLVKAEIAGARGQVEEEKQLVERGLELAPEDPQLLALKGRIALKEGRFDDAIKYLSRALSSATESGEITFALAQALEKQSRREESLRHYLSSLSLGLSEESSKAAREAIKRLKD